MEHFTPIPAGELERRISQIAASPLLLTQVLQAVNHPQTTPATLENILKMDPSFTLKILSLANSAFFGCRGNITNIRAAVMLLGFNMIKSLAIHASVYELFDAESASGTFSGAALWRHSAGVGICARLLSQGLALGSAEDYFTLGILHDTGLILERQAYPDAFIEILRQADLGENVLSVEEKVMGTDHAQLGRRMLAQWGVPALMGEAVGFHHRPLDAPDSARLQACVLHVADRAATESGWGFVPAKAEPWVPEALTLLGLKPGDFAVIQSDFLKAVQDIPEGNKPQSVFPDGHTS